MKEYENNNPLRNGLNSNNLDNSDDSDQEMRESPRDDMMVFPSH